MTEQPPSAEYRIEDLAHLSGATVRTIRAYQDRGLLPRPERRGRANVYGDPHLARLRQISDLLDRGYTLASIKELLEAWDTGRGLGGVLGLVAEIDGPWTDEKAARITRAELDSAFGGTSHEKAVAEAVDLGVLERVPGQDDTFLVPSPQELAVAAELHSAGVPLLAISGHLREVRGQVEHIASRFLDFTTEHVFQPFLDHPPTEAEAAEAAALVRRLRPLAQQTIDAELARAMRTLAARYLRHHLAEALPLSGRETGGEEEGMEEEVGSGRGKVTGRVGCASESPYVPRPSHVPAVAADAGPDAAPVPHAATGSAPDREPAMAPEPESAFGPGAAPRSAPGSETVVLPAEAVQAVRSLVGPENTAAFIVAAAHREVQARTMDALASAAREARAVSETPDAAAPVTRGSDTGTPGTEAPHAPADDPHTDR
ncbi:MerR family transcriptional regulator [Streptomyces sp. GS7]|uniref:MerR family transcriptional regulator n=1 Tax=Streptomyces sp. GS7 TaxID=2692234 RepID=UPI0013164855|nr:MerR family transcriptional regulator [Streptomyces sp. GS7]QHC26498.1 MerR family transcriptional regulator [Streptomyces sp. GS7]